MMLRQPWLLILLAGCTWAHVSLAQTGAPGTPGATDGGLFGNPPPQPQPTRPPTTNNTSDDTDNSDDNPKPPKPKPAPADEGTKPPANPFGFDTPDTQNTPANQNKRPPLFVPNNGASTTFGQGQNGESSEEDTGGGGTGRKKSDENAVTYNAPGLFGSMRQALTAGSGRFAKPKYRYGATVGIGFDSNYQAVPDITGRDPTEVTQVIPAVPEVAVFENVRVQTGSRRGPGGGIIPTFQVQQRKIVLRPFQPEQTIVTPIPGVPATPIASSIVSTGNLYFNTQFAKPREALTFDLRIGEEYYWDRKKEPADYNGSLTMLYLRKLSPRMQFTTNANIVHQSQPDYSLVNVDSNNVGRSYTNGFLKFDLSYRWTPRFSTDTSVNFQALYYDEKLAGQNFRETTFSNEFRYIRSPKITYVVEIRYADTGYPDFPLQDSTSEFLLLGMEQKWSRRLSSTFRVGESLRNFSAGGSQSTPYGELFISYQPNTRSQVSLSSRYGFEQSNSATDRNITLRTSLAYSRQFTRRLSASASVNYVDQDFTSTLTDLTNNQTTTDAGLNLVYQVNRHLTLNANLSYTMLKTSLGVQDYDRTRFFLTGSYDF